MLKLLAFLALAYVGVVALLYFAQERILFPGAGLPSQRLDRPRAPQRLTLPGGDGAELHGMLLRAADAHADLLIGFGGNAQDAEILAQELAPDFPELHTAVFHYRGYGPSTGRPGEAALLADALTIHDALTERLRPQRTYAIGISLGSAVAAWLSSQRRLAGVLLITPFDSIEAVAKESYFWVPVRPLLRHRFASVEFMAGNGTPVAVISAERDQLVRPERTKALVDALPNLVFERVLAGAAHNTLYQLPAYTEALKDAFAALRAAAEARAPRLGAGIRSRGEYDRALTAKEETMAVARVTKITASSTQGFQEAVNDGLSRAAATLRGITGLEVIAQKAKVENGRIVEYRVTIEVTFVLD